jgi:hypothetical protein
MEVSGQLHAPRPPYPRYSLDRRLGGPRAGLDDAEKIKALLGLELRPLGCPARSQSYTD